MLKYFIFLLLPACLLCGINDKSSTQDAIVALKVKRDLNHQSRGEQNQEAQFPERELRSRQTRSANEKKSYIFLDNRSGGTVKLYWRDINKRDPAMYYTSINSKQTISIDTYPYHEWTAKSLAGKRLMMNEKTAVVQKSNTDATRSIFLIKNPGQKNTDIGDVYVEMMVVVDKAALDMHKNDVEMKRYIITYLKLATSILQHKDITQHGVKIHLVLSKLVLLRRDLNEVKLDPSQHENNLRKVCQYMNKIVKNDRQKYDHKLFLTKNSFGVGGYANTRGMCSQYTGCSMVYDHGFTASFLVAHELAHSFGADDKSFGQHSGYVMSRLVDARFDAHRWSVYSQVSILQNIRKFDCIENKPRILPNLPKVGKYPGVHYSFLEQCHLEYDKNYSWKRGFRRNTDPCTKLRCLMPPPFTNLAKTSGSPALDGTECGKNMWCISGNCIDKSSEPGLTAPLKTPFTTVDGKWGNWRQWSKCSRTCSTGLQIRDRVCNNPAPRNGGRYCVGESRQVKTCNTGKVCSKSEKDAVCLETGAKIDPQRIWKFHDTSAGKLDCTFERGMCAWSNEKKKGSIPWRLLKGKTPSSGTGPSIDQTLKTSKGQYIYFETSVPTKAKAMLSSPEIKTRIGCLSFSYHMWGDSRMGQLRVNKISRGVSSNMWKISGNKGDRWYRKEIDVQNYHPYKIIFVAKKKGPGYKSDIALDDIRFRSGPCAVSSRTSRTNDDNPCKIVCATSDNKNPIRFLPSVKVYDGTLCSTKTASGVCYRGLCKNVGCDNILTDEKKGKCDSPKKQQTKQTTNTQASITTRTKSPLDCDFERNYCNWRNLPRRSNQNRRGNELNWLRYKEARRGYYLGIRQIGKGSIKVGSVISPEVNVRSSYCLSFSYISSRRGGYSRLRVMWILKYGSFESTRMKSYLTTTERWKEQKIDFESRRQPYKIKFEATLGNRYVGLIGVDNIRFESGPCNPNKG